MQQQLQRTASNSEASNTDFFSAFLSALTRGTTTLHTTALHTTTGGGAGGESDDSGGGAAGGGGGGGPAIAGTIATLPVSNDQHTGGQGVFLAPYLSITVPTCEFVKSISITGIPAGETLKNAAGQVIDPSNISPGDFNPAFATGSFSAGTWAAQLTLSGDGGSATLIITVVFENERQGVATATATMQLTSDLDGVPVSWTGAGGDGNWFNAANWSSNHVPLPFEDVLIDANGVVDCAGGVSIDSLVVKNGTTLNLTSALFAMTTAAAKPLENHGTISIGNGGVMIVGNSNFAGTAINSGLMELNGGALGSLSIVNLAIDNTGGIFQVDNGSTLTLDRVTIHDGTINDGTINGAGGGIIHVTGDLTIDGNAQINHGHVDVDAGKTLTLNDVTVTGTTINDTDLTSVIQIADGKTLTLSGATINNGTVNDGGVAGTGTIHVTGNSTIDQGAVVNNGTVTIADTVTLTLNAATINSSTINDGTINGAGGGIIHVTGDSTIDGNAQINHGHVDVDAGKTLTLNDVTVTGTTINDTDLTSVIQIADGKTLTLSGATINNGTVNDGGVAGTGTIHVTGNSTIDQGAVVNNGTVTIADTVTLTLNAATINSSTINDGTINGAGGGIIHVTGDSTIDGNAQINHGHVDVDAGKTLTLNDVTVTGTTINDTDLTSVIQIADGKTLTLSGATINNGTVNDGGVAGTGTIHVTGNSTIDQGAVVNNGTVTIADTVTLTLNAATINSSTINDGTINGAGGGIIHVTGDSTIDGNAQINHGHVDVDAGKTLTLNDVTVTGTTINDTDLTSVIQIADGKTLTLSGATINNGTVNDGGVAGTGTIHVTGNSTIDQGAVVNNGTVTIADTVTLTLNAATINSSTINDGTINGAGGGIIHVTGDSTIDGNAQINHGHVDVDAGKTLTLNDVTVTGTTINDTDLTSVIQIADGKTLTLSGATINNGTVNDGGVAGTGTIHVTGNSTIDQGAVVNNGTVTIADTVTLTLNAATINSSTINDGTINGAGGGIIHVTGDLTIDGNAQINHGHVDVDAGKTLTLNDVTVTGTTINDTDLTSVIQIADGKTLTLSGATINNGTVNDGGVAGTGTIHVTGNSTIDQGAVVNNGTVTIADTVTLTLNAATINSSTINDGTINGAGGGIIHVTGDSTIDGNAQINHGHVDVDAGKTLTLNDVTVTGTTINDTDLTSVIQIADGKTLTLSGATINNGTVNDGGVAGTGTIHVTGNSTIDQGAVVNNGTVTIADTVTLTLNAATINSSTINDGTINGAGGGIIHVTGDSTIDGNAQINHGHVDVDAGKTLTLNDVTVTGTTINDTDLTSVIQIADGKTLTLSGATINNGTVNDGGVAGTGTIHVTGNSTIDQGAVVNNGTVTIADTVTLTLNAATINSSTINDGTINGAGGGIIHVTGDSTIDGNAQINHGHVDVDAGKTLTLNDVTVTGTTINDTDLTSVIQIADGKTLTLSGATINNGTVNDGGVAGTGTIHVTGNSTIDQGAVVNNGTVTIADTVTLTLNAATINSSTINDGTINGAGGGIIHVTGDSTIDGNAQINHGHVDVDAGKTLTLNDVTVTGTTINDTDLTSVIQIADGKTLTLSGATINNGTVNDGGVAGTGTIHVTGNSTIDQGAVVNNGTVTIADTVTLTLNAVTINSSTINDGTINGAGGGIIHVTGDLTIDGNAQINHGHVDVDAGKTLTLNDVTVTGTTINDTDLTSVIQIADGKTLTLSGATINNGTVNDGGVAGTGTIHVTGNSTIDQGAVVNNGTVTIADTVTLTLNAATINSSTINDGTINGAGGGIIHVTGDSTIDGNAQINHGHVDVDAGKTLTLNDVTVTGTTINDTDLTSVIQIADGKTLTLSGATINNGTVNDGGVAGTGTIHVTGNSTIDQGAVVNNGTVTIADTVTLTLNAATINSSTINDGTINGAGGGIIHVTGDLTIDGNAQTQPRPRRCRRRQDADAE